TGDQFDFVPIGLHAGFIHIFLILIIIIIIIIAVTRRPSAQFMECSDLVLDPPELVVRYGDPVSVSCRSLSEYTDLGWIVSLGKVSSLDNQTVIWKTDNLTDWEIQPVCYKILNGVQCRSILPLTVYKLPDEVSFSIVNHVGPMVEGRKYELQCDVYNFAPVNVLAVFWYKGEELLKNRGFTDLPTKTPSNRSISHKITAGRDDGEAQYWCEAKLKLGPAGPQPSPIIKSNLLKVAVHYKPVIKNCSAWSPMINTPLSAYPHNVTGNPTPDITWHRDKSPVSPDMILSRNDSGTYGLLAINKMGKAPCAIKITVEYAPTFKCPAIYEGREHDSFLDKCSVMASPVANISWEKDGKMVNPLQNLTRRDSGLYMITAVNKHGVEKHSLTVNVLYGPEIEPGNSSHVMQKDSKALRTWMLSPGWVLANQPLLQVHLKDWNGQEAFADYDSFDMECEKLPDKVSFSIVNYIGRVIEGRKYELQCDVYNFAPVNVLAVFWYKGEELLKNRGFADLPTKTPSNKTVSHKITAGRDEGEAQYWCEAKLKLGPAGPQPSPIIKSNLLKVAVHYGPEIEPGNSSHVMQKGETVSLSCTAEGNPEPEVTWSFQSQTKATGRRQTTLTISEATFVDDGLYTCTAMNDLGNDTRTVKVHVEGDCPIEIQPVKLVVEFGASASANCSTSTTHHGMGWEASQGPVDMEENVQLITWRVDRLTHYDIQPLCYMNIDEQCSRNLPVIVYKRPDRVSISTVDHTGLMTEGRQYTLLCHVHNVAPVRLLTVNWYKGPHLVKRESFSDGTKFPANKNAALQISPSKDDDGVQYRCEAELNLGPEGPQPPPKVTSDPLHITAHRDCPIKIQPVKLVVEFGASASANCSTSTTHHGMGWEASQGPVDMEENVQLITWRVDRLTHWDIKPFCFMNIEAQCSRNLPVIVYKRPDRVSISTVDHTGLMTEGRQYTLLCHVHNVAPVRLLTVNWYKGPHLVKRESFSDGTKFPANKNAALQISPSKDDDGVQYRCEAELNLGPEGPQPPPKVTSDPLHITAHRDCPIKIQPVKLVVEFGASALANCSTSTTHHGMGWEASQGPVDMEENVQLITWRVDRLTHWDIKPFCFMNIEAQCSRNLPVIVYKRPDRVSISTVGHTGLMTEGRQYTLLCHVHNVAPVRLLTVNWYKGPHLVKRESFSNETKFPDNINAALQISPSKDDDGVQYKCEAELNLGPEGPQPPPKVTSDPLNITVHYKPETNCLNWSPMINTPLSSYPYKVAGNPTPDIIWHRDESLVSSDMILSRNDSGRYTFFASNLMGNASCVLSITVEYAPTFACPPSYEGREHDSFLDKCSVMASPEATVTWEKNGKMVNRLHHLTKGDSGSYVITATNKYGTEKHNLTIDVLYKPEINCLNWSPMINTPLSSYPYKVTGNPTPDIIWHRDESLVSSDVILSRNDSGRYTLFASNRMGNASCVINVKMEYAPTFACPPSYEGREHDSFLDKCSVMASPEATVTWEKDGKMVNRLHHLTKGDSGSYVITATNKHGTQQHSLTVDVLYGAKIQHISPSVGVNVGKKVSLQCTAEGYPIPEVMWSFQNQNITTRRHQTTLNIDKAKRSDAGQYTCIAINDLGSDAKTISLTVA
ncbi:intercellular adhesion molecule 5 isoform X1, partial [Clarias magur]